MRRLALLFLVLAAGVFVFAGCGGGDDDEGAAGGDSVDLTQKKDVTIAVITHGEGDSFWAVVKKGAEAAAKDLGVTVRYSESNNNPEEQAQLIEAAITEEVDGIAVSAPDPDAITDPVKSAVDAGIPVITINSGAEESAGPRRSPGRARAPSSRRPAPRRSSASSTSRATSASTSAARARRRASAARSRTCRWPASATSRRR
jgi:ABC-type sugar transport system substrate-binding protein